MYDDFSSPKFKAFWAEIEKELNDRSSKEWSFMIRLENIKRDGNYVNCDCYPEDRREEHFTIKFNEIASRDLLILIGRGIDNNKSLC